jgi:hypothetical protein
MSKLSFLLLFISCVSFASPADHRAIYLLTKTACVSGQANVRGTMEVGGLYSKATLSNWADSTSLETARELVLSVVVTGELGGACSNENKPTILTLTFLKGSI